MLLWVASVIHIGIGHTGYTLQIVARTASIKELGIFYLFELNRQLCAQIARKAGNVVKPLIGHANPSRYFTDGAVYAFQFARKFRLGASRRNSIISAKRCYLSKEIGRAHV